MSTAEKPNILYILADDLGWGDVGFHGSEIRTPTLDRLAADGVELDQHYVCPMCTPTRVTFMSGRFPGRFGKHATVPSNAPVFPDGYQTLACQLRDAGYDTGLFGKWHMGSDPEYGPNHYGFNHSYGSLAGGVDPYNHCYKRGRFSFTWHRNEVKMEEVGHVTDLITNEACNWLGSRTEPWFCYVPFTAVHLPIKAPQEWIDRYQYETYDKDPLRDRSFKRYAAYTSQMDWGIGRIIETLECTGQLDNTLVVFASDNGAISQAPIHSTDKYPGWQEEMPRLGSNGSWRGQKATMYEGGVRSPTILYWRGKLQAGHVSSPVQSVDWAPTLTKLAGCDLKEDPKWDGRDIWPVITGEEQTDPERTFFWNFRGRSFAAMQNQWKLVQNDADEAPDALELYNLAEDPRETTDLAADKPERVQQLLEIITTEREQDDADKREDVDGPLMGV